MSSTLPAATGHGRAPTAVELLERAIAYTRASLVLVTEADLARRTPCDGWTLVDLLTHMDDSLEAMAVGARATSLSLVASEPPAEGVALLASIRHRACDLLGQWHPARDDGIELGGLSVSRDLLGAVGALEIVLHGWDVAQAIDHPTPIPADLAMDLWPVAREHITEADRPFRFAPPTEVPEWATPATRLLAHAGRSTHW